MKGNKCGTGKDIKALSSKRTEKYLATQIKQRGLVPKLSEPAIMQELSLCESRTRKGYYMRRKLRKFLREHFKPSSDLGGQHAR